MSIGRPDTEKAELYYECTDCEYTAQAKVPIGLCPHCGEQLSETSPFA